MSSRKVTVVDYGIGNLLSVSRALAHVGGDVEITDQASKVASAERLVLPGVGAFEAGMRELKNRSLVDAVTRFGETGRPLLGICLGMQLLLEESEEFGQHRGLGLIRGVARALPRTDEHGFRLKVPHIGWSAVTAPSGVSWDGSALAGLSPGVAFYFVHSFAAHPADAASTLATCSFGGNPITAAIQQGNLTGFQFHPEKSGPAGLSLLGRFVAQ